MISAIPFPDGRSRPTTGERRAYRLDRVGDQWTDGHIAVTRHDRQMRVQFPDDDTVFLRAAGAVYAGGFWPDAIATGFTLEQDGDAVILRVYDCEEGEPGPLYVPGVDKLL